MEAFGFSKALSAVFEITALLNRYIDTEAPWKLAKEDTTRLATVLYNIWNGVRIATLLLHPFMPSKTAPAWQALGMGRDIGKASFDGERAFYHAGRPFRHRQDTAPFPQKGRLKTMAFTPLRTSLKGC